MHLTSGVVGVVRVRRSFKSGVLERRWQTQAQLTRSDILRNIDVLGREFLWSLVPLSPTMSPASTVRALPSWSKLRFARWGWVRHLPDT